MSEQMPVILVSLLHASISPCSSLSQSQRNCRFAFSHRVLRACRRAARRRCSGFQFAGTVLYRSGHIFRCFHNLGQFERSNCKLTRQKSSIRSPFLSLTRFRSDLLGQFGSFPCYYLPTENIQYVIRTTICYHSTYRWCQRPEHHTLQHPI